MSPLEITTVIVFGAITVVGWTTWIAEHRVARNVRARPIVPQNLRRESAPTPAELPRNRRRATSGVYRVRPQDAPHGAQER